MLFCVDIFVISLRRSKMIGILVKRFSARGNSEPDLRTRTTGAGRSGVASLIIRYCTFRSLHLQSQSKYHILAGYF